MHLCGFELLWLAVALSGARYYAGQLGALGRAVYQRTYRYLYRGRGK